MSNRFSLAIALSMVLSPALASAQMSTGELPADGRGGRITGELGFYSHTRTFTFGPATTSSTFTMIAPSLYANVELAALTSDITLQLDIAFRTAALLTDTDPGDSSSYFRPGNSSVGVRFAFHGEHFRGRAGVAVTQPWMNAFDGDDEVSIVLLPTITTMGGWDAWLGARGLVTVVLRGDFEWREDIWFVGGETSFGAGIPVEDMIAEDSVLFLQLGVFGGVRPVQGLALGLRFHTAMLDSTRDMASAIGFATLTPFVRGEFEPGFIEGRFLVNLPDNVYYDALGERGWGVYVLGGVEL